MRREWGEMEQVKGREARKLSAREKGPSSNEHHFASTSLQHVIFPGNMVRIQYTATYSCQLACVHPLTWRQEGPTALNEMEARPSRREGGVRWRDTLSLSGVTRPASLSIHQDKDTSL